MNPEIMTLAKQFHIGVLSRGKFMPQQGLSNEEYLLEILRAEAESRDKKACLLYTSPSPRDGLLSRMPSSA